jgi:hypothetical protein
MTSYLKAILLTASAAALMASPALARTVHHTTPHAGVPAYARDVPEPRTFAPRTFVTPYGADLAQPAHGGSVNPDFQVPGNNH